MGTCHFAALLIFLTKVSFEASKFASYYHSCFVVRVVSALLIFWLLKFVVPNMKRKSIFLGLLRCGTTQQFHSVMSNRLCRRCHLCTVMKGRSGCSRIFHLGLFFVDPWTHIRPNRSNRFPIRARQSDFDSSSRWIFSLKSCRSPRNRRYFPRFYPCPPSRVGFGDLRPRFELVHQVSTFLISQFFLL